MNFIYNHQSPSLSSTKYTYTKIMAVKLAPSSCTAAAKGLAQETVNAVELESDAQGCVNVKVDV